jgi:AcrR family transcriptional regulator
MSSQRPPTALQAARQGDRPREHQGTSDAEAAIFAATERLLAEVPLHDISVADIIAEAGVSRGTFYFYFSSKFAVVNGLLSKVMDEIYDVVRPFVERGRDEPAEATLRRSLESAIEVWAAHRPTLRATHEHWHAVAELGERWLGVVERFTDAVAAQIDRERAAGLAPPGPDSRQLAASLLWSTDRCIYIAAIGADDDLPGEKQIVDVLVRIWLGALYGDQQPTTASSARTRTQARRRASK